MNHGSELDLPSIGTPFDQKMMQRCLELARQAVGRTAPNPLVGAVIVKEGKILGEGFHPGPGQPHAEVFALRNAGEEARGATIYVNLEPCAHYGRTPPCSKALIEAGMKKVFVGMIDPDTRVCGKGIQQLEDAGIKVIVGVEEAHCRKLNEAFIHRIRFSKPFGILKYAMTLDGKIATTTGHSSWISSTASRQQVHQLRATCDAVIIGGNTVRRDNPFLTTHQVSEHNPLRVVMSRILDLPLEANLWETQEVPTLVFTETKTNSTLQKQLLKRGVEVIELPVLTPAMVMERLYERGLCSVLWECGGTLAAKAIADGAVQKILAFIAPKIIGGQFAPSPVGDLGLEKMTEALELENISFHAIDSDLLIEGYLSKNAWLV
ncbi:bifunctional diaminohydroxyphosphoribosylaminopyrimidine deaminase/5-amino-6-(5-phosphoribosylamino)uracil reductase RibD [Chroococcus sp. FPU101]|uniref:bifunctional diaminohydroxyphosphoribosylaminopyrimidine deaminase/5-amino-6-(5-phosphoribosylamino)uracil reductase RibD n=1 Tax=Chroococcus sp. FPU101 TaxID=1974212 RepID=UPI001A904024|nr:bifunctional diaminohydroxyphosphoribosylaminopyrimidine deaminase/5-amino-6-(5-phosphoribosylamino)uracil reductase RibD [Chroococcus sp. FPU101]GFE70462.1 riboflavin biosynthesis protein RibD [Chroococcus sp. FPU101]